MAQGGRAGTLDWLSTDRRHPGDGNNSQWRQPLAGDRSHPIQPSELVKLFVVLQAANLFAHWKRTRLDQKLLWLSSFGILVLLILKQPNLSTAALSG